MKRILLGLLLIALGFFAGAQRNIVLGLVGFLAFFTVGITLVIEGYRRKNEQDAP